MKLTETKYDKLCYETRYMSTPKPEGAKLFKVFVHIFNFIELWSLSQPRFTKVPSQLLDTIDQLYFRLTAVAISIGAPTMGSGVVVLIVLFKSIGLPLQDIVLLVPFDWIL